MNITGCMQYTILVFIQIVLAFIFSAFFKMKNNKKKLIYLIFALGILAFMTMFRGSMVGNDTLSYISMFKRISTMSPITYIKNSTVEPGFVLICWIISKISTNPQLIFIITGLFVYYSFGSFIYKYIESPGIVCLSLVTFMKFDFFMSATRQAIAVAILMFGYKYFRDKKNIKVFLLTIIAFAFHYSSIVYIVFYLIYKQLIKNNIQSNKAFYSKWIIGSAIVFVFFKPILNIALKLFPKYSYYIGTAVFDGEIRLAIILQALVGLLIYVISIFFLTTYEKQQMDTKLFSYFSLVTVTLTIIASNAAVFNRFGSIYSLYPMAQYSDAISGKRANYKHNHFIILVISIISFYLYGLIIVAFKSPEWYSTYPFSFVW